MKEIIPELLEIILQHLESDVVDVSQCANLTLDDLMKMNVTPVILSHFLGEVASNLEEKRVAVCVGLGRIIVSAPELIVGSGVLEVVGVLLVDTSPRVLTKAAILFRKSVELMSAEVIPEILRLADRNNVGLPVRTLEILLAAECEQLLSHLLSPLLRPLPLGSPPSILGLLQLVSIAPTLRHHRVDIFNVLRREERHSTELMEVVGACVDSVESSEDLNELTEWLKEQKLVEWKQEQKLVAWKVFGVSCD